MKQMDQIREPIKPARHHAELVLGELFCRRGDQPFEVGRILYANRYLFEFPSLRLEYLFANRYTNRMSQINTLANVITAINTLESANYSRANFNQVAEQTRILYAQKSAEENLALSREILFQAGKLVDQGNLAGERSVSTLILARRVRDLFEVYKLTSLGFPSQAEKEKFAAISGVVNEQIANATPQVRDLLDNSIQAQSNGHLIQRLMVFREVAQMPKILRIPLLVHLLTSCAAIAAELGGQWYGAQYSAATGYGSHFVDSASRSKILYLIMLGLIILEFVFLYVSRSRRHYGIHELPEWARKMVGGGNVGEVKSGLFQAERALEGYPQALEDPERELRASEEFLRAAHHNDSPLILDYVWYRL